MVSTIQLSAVTIYLHVIDGFNGTTAVKQADVVVRNSFTLSISRGLNKSTAVAHLSIRVQPNENARTTRSRLLCTCYKSKWCAMAYHISSSLLRLFLSQVLV
jgi:hypothetical protein